jgi:hypothetical protein
MEMRTILRPLIAAMALVALMSAPTFAQRGAPPSHSNELPASASGESHGW